MVLRISNIGLGSGLRFVVVEYTDPSLEMQLEFPFKVRKAGVITRIIFGSQESQNRKPDPVQDFIN